MTKTKKLTLQGKVQRYLKYTHDYINNKYSEVPNQYRLSLEMLENYLTFYFMAVEDVNKNGIKNENGRINPAFKAQNDAADKINKIISNFGLSPLSLSKIKDAKEEDDEEDFVKALFD